MPKSVTVKLLEEDCTDPLDKLIFDLLSEQSDGSSLSLAEYTRWPKGQKRTSDRALLLLRAGVASLRKQEQPRAGAVAAPAPSSRPQPVDPFDDEAFN